MAFPPHLHWLEILLYMSALGIGAAIGLRAGR